MKEVLLQYLPDPNTVKGGISEVINSVQQNAPELCQNIVKVEALNSFRWFFLAIGAAILFGCLFAKQCQVIRDKSIATDDDDFGLSVFFLVVTIISTVVSFLHLDWVTVILYPKVALFKYFMNILGG